jgi:hypothetical protein
MAVIGGATSHSSSAPCAMDCFIGWKSNK